MTKSVFKEEEKKYIPLIEGLPMSTPINAQGSAQVGLGVQVKSVFNPIFKPIALTNIKEQEETKKEEPNAFDTLNESIEKNYKQYQNMTKKLESYQAEYDYAPDNIKPSLASNFNKLVGQHNDLIKQLQGDIGKRDQMITTTNKINFMKYKQLTGLPGEAGYNTPIFDITKGVPKETTISPYIPPNKTLWNKIGDLLKGVPQIGGETPEAKNAKAQVSYNISQETKIPINTIEQNLDKVTKQLGIRGIPTTGEYVSTIFKFPIMYGLIMNPISAGIGITEYLALTEGINYVGSKMGKWEYKFGEGKGVKDLLPEETSQFTKDVVGVAEFLGKVYLIGKFNKSIGSLKLWDKFTKEATIEYKLPEKIYISAEDSKLITIDEFNKMGIKEGQVLSAREQGIDIEMPLTEVIKWTDKSWFAKLKGLFGIEPSSITTVRSLGEKPTVGLPIKGLLEEPTTVNLYTGLPIDKIVGDITKYGKVTVDMVKGLEPAEVLQIAQQLTPGLATEFLRTVMGKPVIPTAEVKAKEEVSLAKPQTKEEIYAEKYNIPLEKVKITELPPSKKEELTKGLEPELPEFKEEIEREPTAEELRIIDMERQIPENLKKPVPKELKTDYLKIIGKEVKLAKDKMKLTEDIRKDITPSPEILVKYPNLIKELSKPEFTKIEIPKVEIPESLKKPVPPELKNEYLKIIQREVKPAIDKLKIIKDIKENKPISEGVLSKYPKLTEKLAKLSETEPTEIKVRPTEELPEEQKPILSKELKNDYLKIIGKDIKYTPDRLELLRDIRQDIPISEGLQTKYPDLMAKLPEVKFAEIEVRKAVMPEEKIKKPMVESKTLATPEQIKQIHTIADKKAMISEKGKVKPQYRALAKAMTGKISSKEMTEKEAEIFIDSLGRLPEPRLNTKTGELIPPSIARTTKLVTQDFFKRRYKEPTPWRYLTPQSYYAEMLGVKPLVEPYEIGKQEFDLEFRKTSKIVDLIIDKLNKIAETTAVEKFKSKLRNIPTKAESNMAELVNKYEEAPNSLPQEEKDVFNYFRSLSRDLIDRENKVRESVDLPPIKYKKAYFRHTADSMAKEMLEGKYPFPQGLKYWSEKIVGKKIFNPMEFQRKLSDELIDLWSKDLRAVTKSMLWSGLKEIHLTQPAKFFSEQLNAISKDLPIYKNLSPEEQKAYDQTTVIPASTKKWLIDYINQVIKGQETELDASLNRIVTQSGLKGLFNKVLSPFGRTVGRKPITNLFAFGGRITISGVMGWIPRQIIRNIFQQVQNLALYGVKATLKSYLPASVDKNLEGLLTDSLFLKSYTGFEELPTNLMGKLEKVWLAPYGWTAIWNAKQGMKAAYWDTLDLIKNPKYKDLGWADPQRSEDTPRDYLYPSEKEKLLKEMEFGSGCTQYQYIPIGMPEVFRYKALIPVTRLQSWWMNYFTKFTREAIYRGLKGETGYGTKLPWSRRVNYLKYVIIGGAILTALGFKKSFMIAVLPTTLSPAGQLAIGIYNYTLATSDWQRTMALKQIKNSWTAFIPGSLAWKDFIAVWNGEKNLKDLFFYKTTVKEEKQQVPVGRIDIKKELGIGGRIDIKKELGIEKGGRIDIKKELGL